MAAYLGRTLVETGRPAFFVDMEAGKKIPSVCVCKRKGRRVNRGFFYSLGLLSVTRTALPWERGIAPGSKTSILVEIPMKDLM